jgi:hypothetical protein
MGNFHPSSGKESNREKREMPRNLKKESRRRELEVNVIPIHSPAFQI